MAQNGSANAEQPEIKVGEVVASRFRIEGLLGTGGLGPLYRAQDQSNQSPVALRALSPEISGDVQLLDSITAQVRSAAQMQHKNIISLLGMGQEGGTHFVAMEFVDGRSVRYLIQKRRAASKAFTLKGAYNVVAHVCNALTEAHQSMVHGLVGPGSILVNRIGRVKVCEFGIVRALPAGSRLLTQLGDAYCLAPEMRQDPGQATPASDIFSMGILLFELLTGQRPSAEAPFPSRLVPNLGQAVDQVVVRCLAPDPAQRFGSTRELKAALYAAMQDPDGAQAASAIGGAAGPLPAPPAEKLAPVPVPSGADSYSGAHPAPQMIQQPPAPQPVAPQPMAPQPAAPQPMAPQPAVPQLAGPVPATTGIDSEIAAAESDQNERWLIQKDRLDFGPFTFSDLKQQLKRQEFSGDDMMVDQESGERSAIRSHPLFRDYMIQLDKEIAVERATMAEEDRRTQDKKRRSILIAVVAGSLALLGVGGAIAAYYLTREPETREKIVYRDRDNSADSPFKGIDITWKSEPKDQAKKRSRYKRRRRKKSGKNDDVTYLGDATKGGGDALLSQQVVQQVMAANFGKLKGCVVQAARRNPSLRKVVIDFGVRGTGRVSMVKVNKKASGAFQSCIYSRMRGIKFPSFDGNLTRASFSMNLSY